MVHKVFASFCLVSTVLVGGCGLDERALSRASSVEVPPRIATGSAETQIPTTGTVPTSDAGATESSATEVVDDAGGGSTPASVEGDAGEDVAPVDSAVDGDASTRPDSPAPGRCPDIDANGVLDCVETLLVNASFDRDSEGWASDAEVRSSWQTNDGWQSSNSGSVLVLNEYYADSDARAFSGLYQCIATRAGRAYALGAQVWIPAEQEEVDTEAGVQVLFMTEPGCVGYPVGSAMAVTANIEAWTTVSTEFDVPADVIALKVRLGSAKPFRTDAFAALIDNALLRER